MSIIQRKSISCNELIIILSSTYQIKTNWKTESNAKRGCSSIKADNYLWVKSIWAVTSVSGSSCWEKIGIKETKVQVPWIIFSCNAERFTFTWANCQNEEFTGVLEQERYTSEISWKHYKSLRKCDLMNEFL